MTFVDSRVRSDSMRRRLRRVSLGERVEEAQSFLQQFYSETRQSDSVLAKRTAEVVRDLRKRGTYEHTPEELAFGARVAWRNHSRCIGRLNWKSLEVRDCRDITGPTGIARELNEHLRQAYNEGRVRSIISVFAPFSEDRATTFIENAQLAQYAGYQLEEGGVLGDPQNVEFTRSAMALGWRPPANRSAFDLLPLIIDAGGARAVYDLDVDSVVEIPIEHPTCTAVGSLGVRWYAVPVVSDMILTIGGIDYPCAPFNGHYMCTEIASRNLADEFRYGMSDAFASALGIEMSDPLWRDRAHLKVCALKYAKKHEARTWLR